MVRSTHERIMTKAPSPLLGYNNNVRHKNRVFHIQTEDSGVKHPHIITHLFMDGGRILKSVKTSYAEHVGKDKLGDVVRQMMKDQHKSMFRALRDGEFDPVVDAAIAGRKISEPNVVAPKIISRPRDEAVDSGPATLRDLPDDEGRAPLTLDLDVLSADQSGQFKPQNDLPPPPANVLAAAKGDPGTGRYRTVEERAGAPSSRSKSPQPVSARAKSERPAPRSEKKSERPPRTAAKSDRPRPAKRVVDPRAEPPSEPKQPIASQSSRPGSPTAPQGAGNRPAAIFGQAKPQQSSIFGEDIISDKSLDEVILSYLAEDLEEPSK